MLRLGKYRVDHEELVYVGVCRSQSSGLSWPRGQFQDLSPRGCLPDLSASAVRDVLDFQELEKEAGFKVRDAGMILTQRLPVCPLGAEPGFSLQFILRSRVSITRGLLSHTDAGSPPGIILMTTSLGAVGCRTRWPRGMPPVWLICKGAKRTEEERRGLYFSFLEFKGLQDNPMGVGNAGLRPAQKSSGRGSGSPWGRVSHCEYRRESLFGYSLRGHGPPWQGSVGKCEAAGHISAVGRQRPTVLGPGWLPPFSHFLLSRVPAYGGGGA